MLFFYLEAIRMRYVRINPYYRCIKFHSQIYLDLNILKITICSDSERAQLSFSIAHEIGLNVEI